MNFMKLDLDRNDLISLAKGTWPNYSVMNEKVIKENGKMDGQGNSWRWDFLAFQNMSDQDIYETYLMCKNSWSK